MRSSVLSLPVLSTALVLLLQVHQDEATVALTIGAGAGALVLTAGQTTVLASLGVLAKLSGVLSGVILARAASGGSSQSGGARHSSYRGRRSAEVEQLEIDVTLNLLTEMEPEQCFKRIICAAQTGK